MAQTTDVIVVGLGAMGSAALYHLAQRGVRVIGFDRFAPPHALGSTHGLSRIIRESYYEHPRYVPLVQRAYELWAELERRAARRLFHQTGGLMIGDADGVLIAGALRSAREHGLAHEMLSAKEVHARFPGFVLPNEMSGFFEPRAGVLDPEGCVDAQPPLARKCDRTNPCASGTSGAVAYVWSPTSGATTRRVSPSAPAHGIPR